MISWCSSGIHFEIDSNGFLPFPMKTTGQLATINARFFISKDMDEGVLLDGGRGVAAVYSARSPGKET